MKSGEYYENAAYEWTEDSIRLIITVNHTVKSTFFYLQELGYFKTNERYYTERANLDSFLVIYTVSGKGILEYGGKSYEIGTGQCIFIHCMEYHLYHNAPGTDWEFLWFHFSGGNALGYYKLYTEQGFFVQDCQDLELMETDIWEMIALNQKRDLTTEIRSADLIHHMITGLLVAGCTKDTPYLYIPEFIQEIKREMDKHFQSELSLDFLEHKFNRSKFHLEKEFKKYMGVTLHEYLIRTRLSYAKEQLKYASKSVGEIAYEAGFRNVSHFINLFKAREGTTPLQYAKKWRNFV